MAITQNQCSGATSPVEDRDLADETKENVYEPVSAFHVVGCSWRDGCHRRRQRCPFARQMKAKHWNIASPSWRRESRSWKRNCNMSAWCRTPSMAWPGLTLSSKDAPFTSAAVAAIRRTAQQRIWLDRQPYPIPHRLALGLDCGIQRAADVRRPQPGGSHNLVVGPGHDYPSVGGVVFGQENSAGAGPLASVTGRVR